MEDEKQKRSGKEKDHHHHKDKKEKESHSKKKDKNNEIEDEDDDNKKVRHRSRSRERSRSRTRNKENEGDNNNNTTKEKEKENEKDEKSSKKDRHREKDEHKEHKHKHRGEKSKEKEEGEGEGEVEGGGDKKDRRKKSDELDENGEPKKKRHRSKDKIESNEKSNRREKEKDKDKEKHKHKKKEENHVTELEINTMNINEFEEDKPKKKKSKKKKESNNNNNEDDGGHNASESELELETKKREAETSAVLFMLEEKKKREIEKKKKREEEEEKEEEERRKKREEEKKRKQEEDNKRIEEQRKKDEERKKLDDERKKMEEEKKRNKQQQEEEERKIEQSNNKKVETTTTTTTSSKNSNNAVELKSMGPPTSSSKPKPRVRPIQEESAFALPAINETSTFEENVSKSKQSSSTSKQQSSSSKQSSRRSSKQQDKLNSQFLSSLPTTTTTASTASTAPNARPKKKSFHTVLDMGEIERMNSKQSSFNEKDRIKSSRLSARDQEKLLTMGISARKASLYSARKEKSQNISQLHFPEKPTPSDPKVPLTFRDKVKLVLDTDRRNLVRSAFIKKLEKPRELTKEEIRLMEERKRIKMIKDQVDQRMKGHKPYFTILSIVVELIVICLMLAQGFAPWGISVTSSTKEIEVFVGKANQTVGIADNPYFGPSVSTLVSWGSKWAPCMRSDSLALKAARKTIEAELTYGCCINKEYECGQMSQGLCSNFTSNFTSISQSCSTHTPCKSIKLHPCCYGITGECALTTKSHCDALLGKWNENQEKCSTTNCLFQICGLDNNGSSDSLTSNPNQFYRFFTAMFLHVGVIHFLMNAFAQYALVSEIEFAAGFWRTGAMFILTGACGFMISAIFSPESVSNGSSGAIYGMMGVETVDLFQSWYLLQNKSRLVLSLVFKLIIFLGIGTLPYIDNYAHVGGFIAGIVAGISLLPYMVFSRFDGIRKKVFQIVALLLLAVLCIGLLYVFYTDEGTICSGCHYIDCIPFSPGMCDGNQ